MYDPCVRYMPVPLGSLMVYLRTFSKVNWLVKSKSLKKGLSKMTHLLQNYPTPPVLELFII